MGKRQGLSTDARTLVHEAVDRAAGRYTGLVVGALAPDGAAVHGAGHPRLPGGPTPDAETIFEIGSVTKVFTALLLADAVVREEVRLTDPLRAHLPDSVAVPSRNDTEITLEHLATHRSGLPRLPTGAGLTLLRNRKGNPYATLSTEDVYGALGRTRLRRTPGTGRMRYSNFAVGLLGHAVARAAGTNYETLVRTRICDPLGMADTVIGLDAEQRARLAAGHTRRRRPASNWDLPALAGAGALRSTATDMLEFVAAQCGSAPGTLGEAVALSQRPRYRISQGVAMALGWLIVPVRGHEVTTLWHNGGTGGYQSFAACVPERGIGVVVLANTARGTDGLGFDLIRRILDA